MSAPDGRLRLLDELDPGTGGGGDLPPQDPPTDTGQGSAGLPPEDPPTDQGMTSDVCVYWIAYEVYATGGGGACATCAPFVGVEFAQGHGPQPPLHPNCDCFRFPSRWECYDAGWNLLDAGYYR